MPASPFIVTERTVDAQYMREYPHATTTQEAPLKLVVNKYTPSDNQTPQPGDVTLIGLIRCIKAGFTRGLPPLTQEDKKSLATARQRFWDLSKKPIPGFNHDFINLRNGHKLHYIHNKHAITQPKNLIIFFHGFPDSSLMWRNLLSHRDRNQAVARDDNLIVCVDLPGYGGSDSFAEYDTGVLEALAEFCISVRQRHCESPAKVVLVAHDWGCNLATRLAVEAPMVADQFVLMNGLFTDLAIVNFTRHVQCLPQMLSHLRLWELFKTCTLLLRQIWCLAYVFTFDLSERVVGYALGTWNEMAVMRALIRLANVRNSDFDFVEALAATLGPGESEAQTSISTNIRAPGIPESYGDSVQARAKSPANILWNMTGLYRNGVLRGPWAKSEELLGSLRETGVASRRDHGAAGSKGAEDVQGPQLNVATTVIWGLKDHVMLPEICLDGIHAYLAPRSEVIVLPNSAHWVPIDTEGVRVILAVLKHHTAEWQDGRIGEKMLNEVYRGARLISRT
ncbi:alpha/beta fold hydrolase [Aspergillus undulatus]|uniref:alpha/beta fold hydrolase n=1 Tax=Aspergillus undulatus TaxID=1810928 RepID=UPI003CCE43B9